MDEGDDQPTVLVVEDERALVELYVRWLGDDYDVRTAEDGEEALEVFDESVDVVLLDRLMPGMTGDEVLAELGDRIGNCKVAMVTAVDPDFDVITMGFDDYLTKPIEREELLETISRLLSRTEFADMEQELYALVSKQAALRSSKSPEELQNSEAFAELESDIGDLQRELDATLPDLDSDEFVAMVRDIDDEAASSSDGEVDTDADDEVGGDADAVGGDAAEGDADVSADAEDVNVDGNRDRGGGGEG